MSTKCDILYLHATKNPNGEDWMKFAFMPMGIIGILNSLRQQGISVVGMNYAIEKHCNPDFDLEKTLSEMDYKIFMTDLHWYEHAYGSMYVAELSKKVHPEAATVIGGYSTTIFAREIMENFPSVDYAITGDSDLPAQLLIGMLLGKNQETPSTIPNLYYRQNGQAAASPKKWVQTTLDDTDFVSADFFRHSELVPYVTCNGLSEKPSQRWIEIARGCKFNCVYCCGAKKNMPELFGRCNILLRSPQLVAQDFKRLEESGIHFVCPSHDFQMFGKGYYQPLFREIRSLGIRPGLYLECFQLPTRDFLEDILQTFDPRRTDIVISPISGNEQLRQENGKLFSNEDLFEILEFLMQNNLPMQLYYTLNPVGETEEQFLDTYFQIRYLHDAMGLRKKNLFYQRVVLDPLAGLRDFEGTEPTLNTFMDYYRYCQVPTSNFTLTGYSDHGEVPSDKKLEMFHAIVG